MRILVHDCGSGAPVERDATAEEIAAISAPPPAPDPRIVLDIEEAAAVKLDAQVMQFLNMTPIELNAWVDANITGTGLRTALKVLGRLAQHAARGRKLR